MDLETQLENHEQRIRLASVGQLKVVMPGGQTFEDGEHIVGHIPVGALIDGWSIWIRPDELFGGDTTVSLGTESDPTLFADGIVLVESASGAATHNPMFAPLEAYVSNEPLVATIATTSRNETGIISFEVQYSEVHTKAGKYTY